MGDTPPYGITKHSHVFLVQYGVGRWKWMVVKKYVYFYIVLWHILRSRRFRLATQNVKCHVVCSIIGQCQHK